MSKKELQRQVNQLKQEKKALENMMFSPSQQTAEESLEKDEQALQDPKQALLDLKMLYEHNKIDFSERDQMRVLTALYL